MDGEYEKIVEGFRTRATSDAEATMIPIEFDAIVFQEDKSFVAHCPELDVSSCGHNVDEARGI